MKLLAPPNYRIDDHLESRLDRMYTPRTEQELNKLAMDIIQGKVFHSTMIARVEDIQMVFMPLALSDRRNIQYLLDVGAYWFYEYYDKAGPRSINGYPIFFSFRFLNKQDTERLSVKVQTLNKAMSTALDASES